MTTNFPVACVGRTENSKIIFGEVNYKSITNNLRLTFKFNKKCIF